MTKIEVSKKENKSTEYPNVSKYVSKDYAEKCEHEREVSLVSNFN